jgi:uncharacterized protein YjiS (DUF1127 family)
MSTTYSARKLGQAAGSIRRASSFFKEYWRVLQDWRERQKLRAVLDDLSDSELIDIGMTRGEIDCVASNRSVDPRGIRSAEWVRYLPTVDGQIGYFPGGQYTETDFR